MPPVLMQLMRHRDLNTTMVFYVGRDLADAADQPMMDRTLPMSVTFVCKDLESLRRREVRHSDATVEHND
jgi:hypothetical protein